MAKFALRAQARELRKKGISVKTITKQLGVSKSSVSIWVRDIILSLDQIEALRESEIRGRERGRLKGAFMQKQQRIEHLKRGKLYGKNKIGKLTQKEFFIAGVGLYWAEGCKKTQKVEFCNSDPKMIQFFLSWLRICLEVGEEDIKCCVGINKIHKPREQVVTRYWSKITHIPIHQFNKTSFKKVKNKKVYDNFDNHYGVLTIRVAKPRRYYFKIIGLIEALSETNIPARIAQR